jgi:hypothetical protein
MYESFGERRVSHGAPPRTKPSRALTRRAAGSRGRQGADEARPHVGCNHRVGRPQENHTERSCGGNLGKWPRNRRSKEWRKSSAALVEGRRLGPGKASPRHGGGVEAVLAAHAESASAHRESRAPVSSMGRDRGVRGTVAVRTWVRKNTPPRSAQRPAQAMWSVVKRSHPRSRGAATLRVHARRRVGDDEPGADGVRVLVDEQVGSRDRSDASRSCSAGRPQGLLREWDLARTKSPRRMRRPRD